MKKLGFRKGLFGFNCDDVVEYIDKNHKLFEDKKSEYESKIDSLENKLEESRKQAEYLSAQLDGYIKKEKEIDEMAERISEIYLTSKISAEAILKNVEKNKALVDKLVNDNICAVNSADEKLAELKAELNGKVSDFNENMETIKQGISDTAKTLEKNNKEIAEFEKIYRDAKDL